MKPINMGRIFIYKLNNSFNKSDDWIIDVYIPVWDAIKELIPRPDNNIVFKHRI